MARLRGFIAENFQIESLGPSDAADALGCSARNVHRICQTMGVSFGRLLLEARLAAAGRRLAGGGSEWSRITDVAYDCGFAGAEGGWRT